MKIKSIIIGFLFLFTCMNLLSGTTATDRSDIIIYYRNFGWTGINAGWEEDEWLISPEHTLDYDLGETNDNGNVSEPQYIVSPKIEENWGEQTNNQFISNDNVLNQSADDGTQAEVSGLWLTWDSEWIYCGLKAEMHHDYLDQGQNLLVLFDRVRDYGVSDFINTEGMAWDKAIYTREFEQDFMVGVYGGWGGVSPKAIGGCQFREWIYTNGSYVDQQVAMYGPAHPEYDNTNQVDAFYNGDYEFNPDERVLLFRIDMTMFTNNLSNVSSITLKVIAASVDGSEGAGARTYDFCPNNLAGMNSDRKSVADNYIEIPFTDENGEVLMGVSPRYDSKIVYLPGSRSFSQPTFALTNVARNGTTAYARTIFAPQEGEDIRLGFIMPANSNLFQGSIKLYSLRGQLITTLATGQNWIAPAGGEKNVIYTWDGTDEYNDLVPMGNYVVVYTGMTEDGLTWSEKSLISVIH